ncbi:MAG TPA: copper homeostasis protein CutC [Candidatus Baltobacteraceae bacterium]|jgi:copper homeostasis protein|nr:copper homeostasis protein CutC [Candidatus Baltobacteraceae bacterium]
MHLEVLVTDSAEAVTAQQAGATRLELVSEMERGGLTPPPQTVQSVVHSVTIPVHVIVRPHDDGFVYDRAQRQAILRNAARLRDLGVSGVAFGALDAAGHVDTEFVQEVLSVSRLPMTFHRAFDSTPSLSASYATLAAIEGVERVLSAGGADNAWDGRYWLRELCCGNTTPHILGAGAIDSQNVEALIGFTGLREVHVGRGARTDGSLDAGKIERIARLMKLPIRS